MSKDTILDAAEKLFSTKGYYQTTMQDIADEAGVAKGTLYYNFKSKDDLFINLLENGTSVIIHQFRASFDSYKPFNEQLSSFITMVVDTFIKYENFISILFNEVSSGMDDEIKAKVIEIREKYIKIFSAFLQEGYNFNFVRKLNFRIVAIGIIHMLQGMCNDIGHNDKITREEVIKNVLLFMKNGLLK